MMMHIGERSWDYNFRSTFSSCLAIKNVIKVIGGYKAILNSSLRHHPNPEEHL